jgi:hypothetical protein
MTFVLATDGLALFDALFRFLADIFGYRRQTSYIWLLVSVVTKYCVDFSFDTNWPCTLRTILFYLFLPRPGI